MIPSVDKDVEQWEQQWELKHFWWECALGTLTLENSLALSTKWGDMQTL